jgi:hypothetical protein
LKDYYTGTDVENTSSFTELINIDTINNPNEAISLANTYIQAEIGGLSSEYLSTTEIIPIPLT